ncbi:MAG: 4'-phosphopantetheinyl transferase superfamily protein [Steroidobacteraceae bacterium]
MAAGGNSIDIFYARLDDPRLQALGDLCNDDEHARASRFRFPRDARRYRVGRGALRVILGRATDTDPERVRLLAGANQRPGLADLPRSRLDFNVSHSEEILLIGLSHGMQLGVDVEILRKVEMAHALAREHYSAYEALQLREAATQERDRVFLGVWVRKEACVKASGVGITADLRSFTVGCGPQSLQVEVPIERGSNAVVAMHVQSIALPGPCLAACASLGAESPRELRVTEFAGAC